MIPNWITAGGFQHRVLQTGWLIRFSCRVEFHKRRYLIAHPTGKSLFCDLKPSTTSNPQAPSLLASLFMTIKSRSVKLVEACSDVIKLTSPVAFDNQNGQGSKAAHQSLPIFRFSISLLADKIEVQPRNLRLINAFCSVLCILQIVSSAIEFDHE
jgi:hypothetical protein